MLFQFDVYSKNLLKAIDLLITVIGKLKFCKESASTVKNIVAVTGHCIYINDTIATLFEYMVYEFDGKTFDSSLFHSEKNYSKSLLYVYYMLI